MWIYRHIKLIDSKGYDHVLALNDPLGHLISVEDMAK